MPLTRRTLLAGMAAIALYPGDASAASAASERPARTATVRQTVAPGRTLALYLAVPPRGRGRHPAVLVLPDLGGLDAGTRALADHLALLGYVACVPDLLTRAGGTPADAAAARIMTEMLDPAEALADAVATAGWLARNPPGERVLSGRVAAIGVGWGAKLALRLAATAPLAAAVVYDDAPSLPLEPSSVPLLRPHAPLSSGVGWTEAAAFLKEHLR